MTDALVRRAVGNMGDIDDAQNRGAGGLPDLDALIETRDNELANRGGPFDNRNLTGGGQGSGTTTGTNTGTNTGGDQNMGVGVNVGTQTTDCNVCASKPDYATALKLIDDLKKTPIEPMACTTACGQDSRATLCSPQWVEAQATAWSTLQTEKQNLECRLFDNSLKMNTIEYQMNQCQKQLCKANKACIQKDQQTQCQTQTSNCTPTPCGSTYVSPCGTSSGCGSYGPTCGSYGQNCGPNCDCSPCKRKYRKRKSCKKKAKKCKKTVKACPFTKTTKKTTKSCPFKKVRRTTTKKSKRKSKTCKK